MTISTVSQVVPASTILQVVPPSIVSQPVMDASAVTTIINNLNSLYSSAISQLITYTAIIITLVGIIIPLLAAANQRRSLKAEKESLENDIQEAIRTAKSTIRDDLIAEMKLQVSSEEKALISRMEEKFMLLDKRLECAKGSIFFIQGKAEIRDGSYVLATTDFCLATELFLSGDDELNGGRSLKLLIEDCLPYVDKIQYEKFEIEDKINALVAYLEGINEGNRYSDRVSVLKKLSKSAKMKEPKKA